MTLGEALQQLDELLTEEEQALIKVDLERVVSLADRKAELVAIVETTLADQEEKLPPLSKELARSVHMKAHRNKFLLSHLRSCLRVVNPVGISTETYGRDGRTSVSRAGGVVRVRL